MTVQPNSTEIIRIKHSAVFLPPDGPKRLPRAPKRRRPEKFWGAFEDKALFYDCFWDAGGERVLLAGPPPLNLENDFREAKFTAQPSGKRLVASFFPSRSTMLTELADVPEQTGEIKIDFAGLQMSIAVQPNEEHRFAGRNIITTMNRDNDLDWIVKWLDWHAVMHGADAAVIFDNGSGAYTHEELERAVSSVNGISAICIISWPYQYGPYDPGVIFHRHWANFLQMASLQVLHRRIGARANAILNCDIDELVGRGRGSDVFSRARDSDLGLVTLKGQWVEPVVGEADLNCSHHLRYRYRDKSRLKSICANKWCLDPSRNWLLPLQIKPNVHRIYGIDKSVGRNATKMPFFHFKAINTNWKERRRTEDALPTSRHVRLDELDSEVREYQERRAAKTAYSENEAGKQVNPGGQ